jgi:hypothetical protein
MVTKRSPKRSRSSRPGGRKGKATRVRAAEPRFVGREGSPVLDHYPPKDPSLSVRGPPIVTSTSGNRPTPSPVVKGPAPASPTGPEGSAISAPNPVLPGPGAPTGGGIPLISLERPFNIDEFSELLGATTIRVEVPREDLAEAMRRISDFMGFGIYVYSFRIRPAPEELLKRFVIELERVDFSPEKRDWIAFQEKGRSESPFGPSGGRQ